MILNDKFNNKLVILEDQDQFYDLDTFVLFYPSAKHAYCMVKILAMIACSPVHYVHKSLYKLLPYNYPSDIFKVQVNE